MIGEENQPVYYISIAAKMLGVHAQTLRYYERVGLVKPSRSRGQIRLYSQKDIEIVRRIKTLIEDLGVNLAGVEVIMRLIQHIEILEKEREARDKESQRIEEGVQ
ncbi:MAG: MerR family transcriptional regulator [Chloroflexota bacterium]